jgi:hypothetical protein|tara:strand:- start:5113 stop:5949 length:837 start_codon:yes stop_codon:yes gene_type:complete
MPDNQAPTSLAGEATAAKAADKAEENIREDETTVEHRADPPPDVDKVDLRKDTGDLEPADRPDHIPEKFWKDGEIDTEGLAKSYTELEGKFRSGKHKAPKNGEYDATFMDGKVEEDDEMLQAFNKLALDKGFSQQDYEDLVGLVMQNRSDVAQEATFNLDAEKKVLGPQADAIIESQVEWADKMLEAGYLSKDDREEFNIMAGTAAGVRVFMNLRRFYNDTQTIPTNIPDEAAPLPSKEELQQMVGTEEYHKNPAERARVEKLFALVYGTDPDNHVRF